MLGLQVFPSPPFLFFQRYTILSLFTLFALQTSSVFYSTSMCSDKFGDLEMVSSQNGEEREKEKSPLPHPEPLTAVFQQSGGQSPDSRMVSEMPPGWGSPSCLLPVHRVNAREYITHILESNYYK